MSAADPDESPLLVRLRGALSSVLVGIAGGLLLALLAALGWQHLMDDGGGSGSAPREVADAVDLFRLPSTAAHEMVLLPAGPDGIGEPLLSAYLFPREEPPRRFASVLLANVSASEAWEVDLSERPLACRCEDGEAWETFEALGRRVEEARDRLSEPERLRLRSLGAGEVHVTVEPRSVKRVLVALPARRQFRELADVKWGETRLTRARAALDEVRRFRIDPAATNGAR